MIAQRISTFFFFKLMKETNQIAICFWISDKVESKKHFIHAQNTAWKCKWYKYAIKKPLFATFYKPKEKEKYLLEILLASKIRSINPVYLASLFFFTLFDLLKFCTFDNNNLRYFCKIDIKVPNKYTFSQLLDTRSFM